MPRVIITSRKLAATALHLDADVARRASGSSEFGTSCSARLSNVPAVVMPRRHGLPVSGGVSTRVDAAAAHHARRRGARRPRTHDLRLADGEHGRRRRHVGLAGRVDQHDAAGVLGLRGADQAPHRGAGQIGDVLTGQGDRAAGDDDQRGCGRLGQPGLHALQRAVAPRRAPAVGRSAESSATGTDSKIAARRARRGDRLGCGDRRTTRPRRVRRRRWPAPTQRPAARR